MQYVKGYMSILNKIESGEITEENFIEESIPYEKSFLESTVNGKNTSTYEYCRAQIYRLSLQKELWDVPTISDLENWKLLISGWDAAIKCADDLLISRNLPYNNETVSTTAETRQKYIDRIGEMYDIFQTVSLLTPYGHGIGVALGKLDEQEYWPGYFIEGYQDAVKSLETGSVKKDNAKEYIAKLENVIRKLESAGEEAHLKAAHQYRTCIDRLENEELTWQMEEWAKENSGN